LSMSTSLSLDLVPPGKSGISVIEASQGQKGPLGRRVMLGPLRFVNQDCQPNGQVGHSSLSPKSVLKYYTDSECYKLVR
jgi:hypothetical protein